MLRTLDRSAHGSLARLGAWAALAAFLVGWLAPQWHHAEAVHEWCAEHGAYEHADEALPALAEAEPRTPVEHDGEQHLEGLPEQGELDAHGESCQLSLLNRAQTSELPRVAAVGELVPCVVPALRGADTIARSVPLLHQAPKTSPPGVG